VVDAARSEASLGDSEATPFFPQEVGGWDVYLLEEYFAMAFVICVTHYGKVTDDCYTWRFSGYQDQALLTMTVGMGGIVRREVA